MLPLGKGAELCFLLVGRCRRIDDRKDVALGFSGQGGVSLNLVPELIPGLTGGTDRNLAGELRIPGHDVIVDGLAALLQANIVICDGAVG